MINDDIIAELYFLLHSFVLGILTMILYDILRIFRKIVKHSVAALAIEDLIYWLICGICIFLMLYQENNGSIRWFAIAGVACGMLLYNGTISAYVTDIISKILKFILKILGRVFRVIFKPFGILFHFVKKITNFAGNKGKKFAVFNKKQLKKTLKTVKIILSRH